MMAIGSAKKKLSAKLKGKGWKIVSVCDGMLYRASKKSYNYFYMKLAHVHIKIYLFFKIKFCFISTCKRLLHKNPLKQFKAISFVHELHLRKSI